MAFLVAQTPGLEEEAGKIAVGLLIFAIIVRMLKDPVVLLFIPFFLLPLHLLFESVDDEKAAYETIGFWVISVISVSVGLAIILRAITVSEKLKKHKQCSIPPIR